MHMADALISPAVGGTMWAASGYLTAVCAKRIHERESSTDTALMGVLSAFVFASQMINFAIPGTGSSGHIGGGLLLAVFLGPERAFISMLSILAVQALFFADGGLLALGCNIFNMGFFPCFIAYPLIYKKITKILPGKKGVFWGSLVSVAAGLEMGAFAVVAETIMSGITTLPFDMFVLFMMPIHLAIGIAEGLATALVVTFVYTNAPEAMQLGGENKMGSKTKKTAAAFMAAAILIGGVFSWYASSHPDGLEWSIAQVTGSAELETPKNVLYSIASEIQSKTAFLPDYSIAGPSSHSETTGTSLSGVLGALLTLIAAAALGLFCKNKNSVR